MKHRQPALQPQARRRTGIGGSPRGRVLVVDVRPAFAEGAAALLRREGFEAFAVHRVPETERRARRLAPELVLLGPGLPAGLERSALYRLRRATRTAGVPVFRIADAPRPEEIAAGFAAGLDDCILRPFFPDELFGRIDRALERLRFLRRLQSESGLAAGRAAEQAIDEGFARGWRCCLVLYLPGFEELAGSDRAAALADYLVLRRELPHRLVEILPVPGKVGREARAVLAEPRPGQIYILAGGDGPRERRLTRLLGAANRWLRARVSGNFLAPGADGSLARRAMPAFHLLHVSCSPGIAGFAALDGALRLELARDHSGRRGGRFRRLRI